jgi:hypothetical protein
LRGPEDFELQQGSEDDGENYGGARILKAMQLDSIIDAVVICSRWWALVPRLSMNWALLNNIFQ